MLNNITTINAIVVKHINIYIDVFVEYMHVVKLRVAYAIWLIPDHTHTLTHAHTLVHK